MIETIPNQPINFVEPLSCFCDFNAFCLPYLQTDQGSFQAKNYLTGDLLGGEAFNALRTGTTTADAANKLIDGVANFQVAPFINIQPNYTATVKNTSTDAITNITAVDGANQLSIGGNIFLANPEGYAITNWGFQSVSGDQWNHIDGKLEIDDIGWAARYEGLIAQNKIYVVTVKVENYLSGTIKVLFEGTVAPFVQEIGEITSNGTFTFAALNVNAFDTLGVNGPAVQNTYDITDVQIRELTPIAWRVVDCDNPTNSYFEEYDISNFTYGNGFIKSQFDWSDLMLDDGCYCLCLVDYASLQSIITNYTFDDPTGWTTGTGWGISGGSLNMSFTTLAPESSTFNVTALTFIYDWSFTVFDFLSGSVTFGYNDGVDNDLVTATANGTFTGSVALTPSVNYFYFRSGVGAQVYKIDNCPVFEPMQDSIPCSFVSDCVKIGDEAFLLDGRDDVCTYMATGENDQNAFGFDFNGFTFYQRFIGNIRNPTYNEDREVFEFSDNSFKTLYASSNKIWAVQVAQMREPAHDSLSLIRLTDDFEIDSVGYIPDGSYNLEWKKQSNLTEATFNIKKKQGIQPNQNC